MFKSVKDYVGDLISPAGCINEIVLRGNRTINDTKIKYILISDKIYKVKDIDFSHLTLEAEETGLRVGDVEEDELWEISDLEEFEIRLVNSNGGADVIDMAGWLKGHGIRE